MAELSRSGRFLKSSSFSLPLLNRSWAQPIAKISFVVTLHAIFLPLLLVFPVFIVLLFLDLFSCHCGHHLLYLYSHDCRFCCWSVVVIFAGALSMVVFMVLDVFLLLLWSLLSSSLLGTFFCNYLAVVLWFPFEIIVPHSVRVLAVSFVVIYVVAVVVVPHVVFVAVVLLEIFLVPVIIAIDIVLIVTVEPSLSGNVAVSLVGCNLQVYFGVSLGMKSVADL